jgi:WD40 repeat protein
VAFSRNGRWIAAAGFDGRIGLWSAKTGKRVRVYEGHRQMVQSLQFDPGSERLLSAGDDATIRVWRVPADAD